MPTMLSGWYVVTENVTYTNNIYLDGGVTIILANGKTMNVGTSEAPITSGYGGIGNYHNSALTIYGQSLNDATAGTLNIFVNYSHGCINIDKSYTQHSGNVYASNSGENAKAILADTFTMNGGKLEAASQK